MKKKLLIIGLGLFVLGAFLAYKGLDKDFDITRYEFKDKSLGSKVRIVFLSDIHSDYTGPELKNLLREIKTLEADIILIGGDAIDDRYAMEKGLDLIKEIAKLAPSFYATGNHEERSGYSDLIKDEFKSYGVKVLEGTWSSLDLEGGKIDIMGLDDPLYPSKYKDQLSNLEIYKSNNLTILLAHRPNRFEDYKDIQADYIFSGHAHGGQWRLPLILEDGLYAPGQGLFPKLTKGIHRAGHAILIISRGLATESVPVPRIYNPPELVVVDLLPEG